MTTAPLTEARAEQVAYCIAVKWSSRAGLARCTNEIVAALLRYTTEAYEAGRRDGANPKLDGTVYCEHGWRYIDGCTICSGSGAGKKEVKDGQ